MTRKPYARGPQFKHRRQVIRDANRYATRRADAILYLFDTHRSIVADDPVALAASRVDLEAGTLGGYRAEEYRDFVAGDLIIRLMARIVVEPKEADTVIGDLLRAADAIEKAGLWGGMLIEIAPVIEAALNGHDPN